MGSIAGRREDHYRYLVASQLIHLLLLLRLSPEQNQKQLWPLSWIDRGGFSTDDSITL